MKKIFLLIAIGLSSFVLRAQEEQIIDDIKDIEEVSQESEAELPVSASSDSGRNWDEEGTRSRDLNTEKILHFHADIKIDSSGEVQVTETILVNALGYDIQRGIFRVLPLRRNLNGQKNRVKYKKIAVERNHHQEPFHTERNGDTYFIYIGDKDHTLDPGVYEYTLQYTTDNQIGFFEGYDEFYWNVNGNDWDFPMDKVSATVHLPSAANILQNACYTGAFGEKNQDCVVQESDSHTISWQAGDLGRGEGLTVAVGFNKGVFVQPPPPSFLELHGIALLLLVVLGWFLRTCYRLWRKYGIDPPKPTVYPQFRVPDGLTPAAIGYLKYEGTRDALLSAALVHLAVKGNIKIEEKKKSKLLGLSSSKEFTLHKLDNPKEKPVGEEERLMGKLFSGSSKSIKIDGVYHSKVAKAVRSFNAHLDDTYLPLLKEGRNLRKLVKPFLYMLLVYILALIISWILTGELVGLLTGLFFGGFFGVIAGIVAYQVNKVQRRKVVGNGCSRVVGYIFLIAFLGVWAGTSFLAAINTEAGVQFQWTYLFLFLSFIALIVFAYLIKKPSEEKLRIKSLIEGFEMYMGAAENEQIKFNNPPDLTPELFERFLPYAMALGVDKVWGKRFEDLLEKTSLQYESTWYVGSAIGGAALGTALSSSLTSTMSSSSTAPSSSGSGSSFSSGSGGGGSSGGGGGGGGGGGW